VGRQQPVHASSRAIADPDLAPVTLPPALAALRAVAPGFSRLREGVAAGAALRGCTPGCLITHRGFFLYPWA
jgi:hypothetical protein